MEDGELCPVCRFPLDWKLSESKKQFEGVCIYHGCIRTAPNVLLGRYRNKKKENFFPKFFKWLLS